LLSGTVPVITGLHGHSVSVLAIGLGVIVDVTGAAALRAQRSLQGRCLVR